MKHRLLATIAGLAAATTLAACGQKSETETAQAPPAANAAAAPAANSMAGMNMASTPPAKTVQGTGTVTAVDAAAGTITIDHAPIAEANWPAMTMAFKASPELARTVKAGDKVAFGLKLQDGGGEITALQKQ